MTETKLETLETFSLENSEIFDAFKDPLDPSRLLGMAGVLHVLVAHHQLQGKDQWHI